MASDDMVANEPAVNFNMFGPLMKEQIGGNLDSTGIACTAWSNTNEEYSLFSFSF